MIDLTSTQLLLLVVVATPGVVFAGLGLTWLVAAAPGERVVARLGGLTYFALLGAAALLWWRAGGRPVVVPLGHWFATGAYAFDLTLVGDALSLPMIGLTVLLAGVIGHFSYTYLHRERGYFRFFALLHLFAFGALLAFAAGTLDLLVAGWELVGITSVLLIAFFHERPEPVNGALRVFGIYRAADLGLLVSVVLLHHWLGSGALTGGPPLTGTHATVVGLLLLVAASGKSAQVPFSGWLPRAMEGPTPSSAIFYGAISVHLGAYLLLRVLPIVGASLVARAAIIAVGVLTAMLGTLAGRAAADAKTSLAYASLTQVGLVFAEIGAGFPQLALVHMLGHALVRTLQFLRAPSMLHDHHQTHAAVGGHHAPTGTHFERLLPAPAQLWLYRLAVDRGALDILLDRLFVGPVTTLSVWLGRVDEWTNRRPSVSPVADLAPMVARVEEGLDG